MRQRPSDLCRVRCRSCSLVSISFAFGGDAISFVVLAAASVLHYSWLTSSVAPQDDSTSARKKNTVKNTRTVNLGTGPRRGGNSSSGTHEQQQTDDAPPAGNSSTLTVRTFNNSGQVDLDDGENRHTRRRTNANSTNNHIYDSVDADLDEL